MTKQDYTGEASFDVQKLREFTKAAAASTRGPWRYLPDAYTDQPVITDGEGFAHIDVSHCAVLHDYDRLLGIGHWADSEDASRDLSDDELYATAEYIVAAQPDVMLELLDRLDREIAARKAAQQELAELREKYLALGVRVKRAESAADKLRKTALAYPRDAAEVRAFIGGNCDSAHSARSDGKPSDNDRYKLSAHDLLSAFENLRDFGCSDELAELERDAARLDWLADPANTIGNVQLPTECVERNLHSLRAAIDDAMEGSQ